MQLKRYRQRVIATIAVTLLAGCGGGERADSAASAQNEAGGSARALAAAEPQNSIPVPNIAVIGLTKVRETRIGRTEFEYVYSVTLSNTGTAAADVLATLSQVPTGTRIIDGNSVFGSVSTSMSQTSLDTITIRQDRTIAFVPSALRWNIFMARTSDPIGMDSNNNGVRDDIETAANRISLEYPQANAALLILARTLQTTSDAPASVGEVNAQALLVQEMRAGQCLALIVGARVARFAVSELTTRTFDTSIRRAKRQSVLDSAGAFELPSGVAAC